MRPEDIIGLLRAYPFEPFRIYVSDGASFDVRHPEMVIVERSKVLVGVPGKKGLKAPVEKTVNVALVHITRTEPITGHAKVK